MPPLLHKSGAKGEFMKISAMNFPRQLEAAGAVQPILEALAKRKARLSAMEVPVLSLTEALDRALRKARLQRRVRLGFEEIFDKLAAEKKGLDEMHQKTQSPQADRISRLLLFSNDGAERLYRHIEQILTGHAPRILGCLLDVDGKKLGQLIAGNKSKGVKVILIEHKDAVSDILRTLIEKQE